MSEITADQIEQLRLLAFKTNNPAHIENYRSATVHWFQSRHYRDMEAARTLEHWRHEVGKLHSQIGKRDDALRECLAWVRHWQADVAGNLKPTPDSLSMMEAKLVAILQPVEAPEAAE